MKIKYLDRHIEPKLLIYLLLLGGFLIGMVLAFIGMEETDAQGVFWLDNILMYLQYGDVQYGDMLFYVLRKRITFILLLVILCMSGKGKYFLLSGVGVAGGFVGYFITEFIIAKGILGSLIFVFSIFPHYLCYAYAYYRLLIFILKFQGHTQTINQLGQKQFLAGEKSERDLLKKILPVAVVIIGILLECYVNPFFLKIFLKIFM